ncbi:MAG: hypothetical protein KIT72_06300 [Polyangiaceae bacterium]|nr:hypothetical protein [Polyangiaceae bacterium]MCW5790012.1 hypothetical protein [Polyangiaceae bacterium]
MARGFVRVAVLLGALGVLTIACSSGDGGGGGSGGSGGGGTTPISGEEFGTRYCELFNPCCRQANRLTDQPQCKQAFSRGPVDGVAAHECLKEYEARAKELNWCDTAATAARPASCARAFPTDPERVPYLRNLALGEACGSDADCALDPRGVVTCDFQGKFCRLWERRQLGEACQGEVREAGEAWWDVEDDELIVPSCLYTDSVGCEDGVCIPLPEAGEPCTHLSECVSEAYCSGEQVCVPRQAFGEPCQSGTCELGLRCGSGTGLCEALRPQGQPCEYDHDCLSAECVTGVCQDPGLTRLCR